MSFQATPVDDAPTEQDPAHATGGDPIATILAEQLIDQIWMAEATSRRSTQGHIGPSELGTTCDRQLAYRLAGTRKVNHPDPLRVIFGSGLHAALQEMFARIDGGADRFLIEHPVAYRGVSGTVDLYDSRRQAVIDWKSTTKGKLRDIRRRGPNEKYKIQAHTYGAALAAAGYPVRAVALAFVPLDGELADIHVWTAPLDVATADAAVDRLDRLRAANRPPEDTPADPSRLCPWCSHYRPDSTDLAIGCPGPSPTK